MERNDEADLNDYDANNITLRAFAGADYTHVIAHPTSLLALRRYQTDWALVVSGSGSRASCQYPSKAHPDARAHVRAPIPAMPPPSHRAHPLPICVH
jgi:hypothetical protein